MKFFPVEKKPLGIVHVKLFESSLISSGYAKDHEPCIIFMDEIDAIGKKYFLFTTLLPLGNNDKFACWSVSIKFK